MLTARGAFLGQSTSARTVTKQNGRRFCLRTRLLVALLVMVLSLSLSLIASFAAAPHAYAQDQVPQSSTSSNNPTSTSAQANTSSTDNQSSSAEDEVDPNATIKVVLLCVGIPVIAGVLAYLYKSRKIKAAKEAKARKEEIAKRGL